MSNIEKIAYDDANDELKALYDEILVTLKFEELPNWVLYLGKNIFVLRGIWQMFCHTALEGSLNPLLKELIVFSVSRAQGSPYCSEFHASQILRMTSWLGYQELIDIIDNNSRGIISDQYRTAIDVMTRYSQSHCILKPDDIEKLKDVGFNDLEILELAGLCALALAFNSLTMAANIPIETKNKVDGFFL